MEGTINAGDIVRLKSGGPKMTVTCVNEALDKKNFWCHCSWFDNDRKPQTTIFPDVALDVVGPCKVISTKTDWEKTIIGKKYDIINHEVHQCPVTGYVHYGLGRTKSQDMQAILEEAEIVKNWQMKDQVCCESK